MPEYELRTAFPLRDHTFAADGHHWICRLAEVSDQRPNRDRISWYLVFESQPEKVRKLEIVTSGDVLQSGWGSHLEQRVARWLDAGEQYGRVEFSAV